VIYSAIKKVLLSDDLKPSQENHTSSAPCLILDGFCCKGSTLIPENVYGSQYE